jgi:hypothetical protein
MPPPPRSPDEIRASIEHNRAELGTSLEKLRGEVEQLTDWRLQLRQHRQQFIVAAVIGGFVLGGGFAGLNALLSGRGRRKKNR